MTNLIIFLIGLAIMLVLMMKTQCVGQNIVMSLSGIIAAWVVTLIVH